MIIHDDPAQRPVTRSFDVFFYLRRVNSGSDNNAGSYRYALVNRHHIIPWNKHISSAHEMETFFALLALGEGNPTVTGGIPSPRTNSRVVGSLRRLNVPVTSLLWVDGPAYSVQQLWYRRIISCTCKLVLAPIWNITSIFFRKAYTAHKKFMNGFGCRGFDTYGAIISTGRKTLVCKSAKHVLL